MSAQPISEGALYARVQLEAARKHLRDCKERENAAFDAYLDAMDASIKAIARESAALSAWLAASRPVAGDETAQAEEPPHASRQTQ
jgi:hypothetical protein